jgi:hypothetical protein
LSVGHVFEKEGDGFSCAEDKAIVSSNEVPFFRPVEVLVGDVPLPFCGLLYQLEFVIRILNTYREAFLSVEWVLK